MAHVKQRTPAEAWGGRDGSFQWIHCAACDSPPSQHLSYIQTQVTHAGHLYRKPLQVVICAQCGLAFLNPQPKAEALARFYESEYYAGSHPISEEERLKKKSWRKEILYDWLVTFLPPMRDWTILDIGCGYGEWLKYFEGNKLIGIEQSLQAAEAGRKALKLDVRTCDFMANGFAGEHFDLITGLAILEHFLDPLAALVEMNRILKPGSFVYIETPDLHGMVLRGGIPRFFKLVHTYYYTEQSLRNLLHKAGFEVVGLRHRSPVLNTCTTLRPTNYWSGELDVVARKEKDITLQQARAIPAAKGDVDKSFAALEEALARDEKFARLGALYRKPVLGKLCHFLVRLGMMSTGQPVKKASVHKAQMEMLRKISTP